jgi:hypothetical protein
MGLLYDYHVMLTLGFFKVTRGYVIKAEPKPCPLNYNIKPTQALKLLTTRNNCCRSKIIRLNY